MSLTAARRRANNKYIAQHMTVLGCKVRREYADRVRACCAAQGDTINAVLRAALDAYLEEHEQSQESEIP